MQQQQVRQRRSGKHYRDTWLSDRHRLWGFNCPAADVDFLLLEFNNERPVALIDYKESHHQEDYADSRSSRNALKLLADNSKIPFLIVKYVTGGGTFQVLPQNEIGAVMCASNRTVLNPQLTEVQYVDFLYWLRGMQMPLEILEDITA